jgi:hypothetical protein
LNGTPLAIPAKAKTLIALFEDTKLKTQLKVPTSLSVEKQTLRAVNQYVETDCGLVRPRHSVFETVGSHTRARVVNDTSPFSLTNTFAGPVIGNGQLHIFLESFDLSMPGIYQHCHFWYCHLSAVHAETHVSMNRDLLTSRHRIDVHSFIQLAGARRLSAALIR